MVFIAWPQMQVCWALSFPTLLFLNLQCFAAYIKDFLKLSDWFLSITSSSKSCRTYKQYVKCYSSKTKIGKWNQRTKSCSSWHHCKSREAPWKPYLTEVIGPENFKLNSLDLICYYPFTVIWVQAWQSTTQYLLLQQKDSKQCATW